MATKICQRCGKVVKNAHSTRKYCAECSEIVSRELSAQRNRRYVEKRRAAKIHRPLDPLAEIALEVQAYNDNRGPDDPILSYGQYVAKFGK